MSELFESKQKYLNHVVVRLQRTLQAHDFVRPSSSSLHFVREQENKVLASVGL